MAQNKFGLLAIVSLGLIGAALAANPFGPPPTWTPCYLDSEGDNTGPMVRTNIHFSTWWSRSESNLTTLFWFAFLKGSECANFSLPLNYSEPDGKRIDIFVKRTLKAGAQRALFVIPGGPGESGASMDGMVPMFGDLKVPYDVYQVDHRGTGRSHRLNCADPVSDYWGDCAAYLQETQSEYLPHITTSNVASDYNAVFSSIENRSIVLLGASYGTYLSNRIMSMYPDAITAAVVDGIFMGPNKFPDMDRNLNHTAKTFADQCDLDPTCREHFGNGLAFQKLVHIVANFDSLPCSSSDIVGANFTSRNLRLIFYHLLASHSTHGLIFPLALRLNRCSKTDQIELRAAMQVLNANPPLDPTNPTPPQGDTPLTFCRALTNHIAVSELWNHLPDGHIPQRPEIVAISDSVPIATYMPGQKAAVLESWMPIRYKVEEPFYSEHYAQNATFPVLILNGNLDPATSVLQARQARDIGYNRANQRLIEFEGAGHPAMATSPVRTSGALPCGFQTVFSFLNSDNFDVNAIDTSCMADMVPVDYAGKASFTMDWARKTFGTENVWGTAEQPVDSAPSQPPQGMPIQAPVSSPVAADKYNPLVRGFFPPVLNPGAYR